MDNVDVYLNIKGTLTLIAGLNVYLVPTVRTIKHVCEINASILVSGHADKVQSVK